MSGRDETIAHIQRVIGLGLIFERHLIAALMRHDFSKLEEPEASGFERVSGSLRGLTYGSEEYKAQLAEMKPFLDHHYQNNRHHPEHFDNGVDGMTLIDLVEMFCDWKAATERHADGDLDRSITLNQSRFNLSPQLVNILKNTKQYLDW